MTTPYKNQNGNIIGSDESLLDNREFSWENIQKYLYQVAFSPSTYAVNIVTKTTMGLVNADRWIRPLAVYDGKLWLGIDNTTAATDSTAAKIVTYDGTTWTVITKATMGAHNNDTGFVSMVIYNNKLYISTQNSTAATDSTAAKLLVYDASTDSWSSITKATMGAVSADSFYYPYHTRMAVYNGKLYLGTYNTTAATDSTAAKMLIYEEGVGWSVVDKATMGGVNADTSICPMIEFRDVLYIGTNNATAATDSTGAKVITYNGAAWSVITKATMGAHSNDKALSRAAIYNGRLWIGTWNQTIASDATAAKLICFDGTTWNTVTKTQTSVLANNALTELLPMVYNGMLCVIGDETTHVSALPILGTLENNVWWNFYGDFWYNGETGLSGCVPYQGKLYCGTYNTTAATDDTAAKLMFVEVPIGESLNNYTARGF